MTQSDPLQCDVCKEEFVIKPTDIRRRQTGELIFTYFKCPHCDAAYLISALGKEDRRAIKRGEMTAERMMSLNAYHWPEFKRLFPTACWRGGMPE